MQRYRSIIISIKKGGGVKKKNHLVLIKIVNYDVKRILLLNVVILNISFVKGTRVFVFLLW